jgi:Predicted metal-binding integral membrane protein (DUF2182)
MPMRHAWNWVEVGALSVMWAVMMIAMMTPAATPMVLMFASMHRRRKAEGRPAVPTAIFVLGYLVVWMAYSVMAALAQVGLHAAALLSPAMAATSPFFAGGLLVAAGVFQWTPLKRACLAACRTPLSFLMSSWREGAGGAFVMGLRHGLYCLGCCPHGTPVRGGRHERSLGGGPGGDRPGREGRAARGPGRPCRGRRPRRRRGAPRGPWDVIACRSPRRLVSSAGVTRRHSGPHRSLARKEESWPQARCRPSSGRARRPSSGHRSRSRCLARSSSRRAPMPTRPSAKRHRDSRRSARRGAGCRR